LEGTPALTGIDSRLRDHIAEPDKLTMNARRTPKQIFNAHAPD